MYTYVPSTDSTNVVLRHSWTFPVALSTYGGIPAALTREEKWIIRGITY